jgi:uncharacterized membrane protein YbhN (UPF0104 family)
MKQDSERLDNDDRETPVGMKTMIKKWLTFILKYCIGFFLLGWVLSRINVMDMLQALAQLSVAGILVSILFAALNIFFQYRRWKYLLEKQSSDLNKADILPSFFAGHTLRLVVPGGHAEISKIFFLSGKKGGKLMAFGIEKIFQTYFKLVLALIALPLVFSEYRSAMWSLAGLGIAAFFIVPVFGRHSFLKRFHEKEVNYFHLLRGTLWFTLLSFLSLDLQFYILLREIYPIGFWPTLLVVIFILAAGLIPISISGLGVRENVAAFFLARYAVPGYAAVGISLFTFFFNTIAPALVGVYFIYQQKHALHEAKAALGQATRSIYFLGKTRLGNGNTKKAAASDPQYVPDKFP